PLDELLSRISALPSNTIIIFLSYFEDERGQHFVPRDVVDKIVARANAPTYSPYDTFMGRGIVGGQMDSFDAIGKDAGALSLRVLDGEDPARIPAYKGTTKRLIVDARQIER